MIVAMKKLAIITQSKDADTTVSKLRSLGVVHVEHKQPPKAKAILALCDDIALINEALGILSQPEFLHTGLERPSQELGDWRFTSHHIVSSRNRIEQLEEYSSALINQISEWEQWGDFEPQAISQLAEKGIFLRLYRIPEKEIKKIPPSAIVKKISSSAGFAYCVVITREEIQIPFKEITPPKIGLAKMRQRLSEDRQVIEKIKAEISRCTGYIDNFIRVRKSLEKELEFQEALKGMAQAGSIVYLSGFIPFDAADSLLQVAKQEKWGVVISEPSEQDRVPTLVRNPAWISLISPVFKALEIVPGYRELDISLWFLLFLSIFFGMLIGDAGYGGIFFLLTLFAQRKWAKRIGDRAIFILLYIFSFSATGWGVLSGTFFGQEWLPESIKPIVPALRDNRSLQAICFFLGALHLSIAHSWRAIIKLPSLTALSEIGWIMVLWGVFLLARTLILGAAWPIFGKWFFIVGASLVVFFTSLEKNPLKGIGKGLVNLLLNLVNSFTDVVSYIRLFAVGLATVAVADAFNKMAGGIGFSNIWTSLATALILFVGHALNIILGPMSVLVHGVRLNVLEFCNHVDVKWSGFLYKPLSEGGKG